MDVRGKFGSRKSGVAHVNAKLLALESQDGCQGSRVMSLCCEKVDDVMIREAIGSRFEMHTVGCPLSDLPCNDSRFKTTACISILLDHKQVHTESA